METKWAHGINITIYDNEDPAKHKNLIKESKTGIVEALLTVIV